MAGTNLYSKIAEFIESLEVEALSLERKLLLQPLIAYIQQKPMKTAQLSSFLFAHTILAEAIWRKFGRKQWQVTAVLKMYFVQIQLYRHS